MVRLQDGYVLGRWKESLRSFTGLRSGLLLEDFVNWSNEPDEILRFTEIYGPLDETPVEGKDFKFSLDHWKGIQSDFRVLWEGRARAASSRATVSGSSFDVSTQDGKLLFLPKRLDAYLTLELILAPDRFRKWSRQDCPHPYFIASHLKQQYCSPECAEWAQAQ